MAKREIKSVKEDVAVVQMETTVTEPEVTTVKGKLCGCKKLNVRKSPSVPKKDPSSNVVTTIDDKTDITINLDKSNDNWYNVTVGNVYGYCMKEYISIK